MSQEPTRHNTQDLKENIKFVLKQIQSSKNEYRSGLPYLDKSDIDYVRNQMKQVRQVTKAPILLSQNHDKSPRRAKQEESLTDRNHSALPARPTTSGLAEFSRMQSHI